MIYIDIYIMAETRGHYTETHFTLINNIFVDF